MRKRDAADRHRLSRVSFQHGEVYQKSCQIIGFHDQDLFFSLFIHFPRRHLIALESDVKSS